MLKCTWHGASETHKVFVKVSDRSLEHPVGCVSVNPSVLNFTTFQFLMFLMSSSRETAMSEILFLHLDFLVALGDVYRTHIKRFGRVYQPKHKT